MKKSLMAAGSCAAVVFALLCWNAWPTLAQDPIDRSPVDDTPRLDPLTLDPPRADLNDDASDLAPLGAPADKQPQDDDPTAEPARGTIELPGLERQAPREIRVFTLRSVKASEVIEILKNFVEENSLRMHPDKQKNALIVEGETHLIRALQKIIERIDPPTPARSTISLNRGHHLSVGTPIGLPGPVRLLAVPSANQTYLAPSDPELAKLTQEYKDLNTKVIELLKKHGAADDDEQRDRLREEIVELTNQQFDLRQRGREVEVERLKKRLGEVEGNLKKRAELKDQIVDKRVAQILQEPDELQWESLSQTPRRYERITTADGAITRVPLGPVLPNSNAKSHEIRVVPREITERVVGPDGKVREIKRIIQVPERVETNIKPLAPALSSQTTRQQPALAEPNVAPRATPATTIQSNMSVAEAEARLRITKEKLAATRNLIPGTNNGSRNELAIKRAELKGELELAELQLAQAKHAAEATERLLNLEIRAAESNFEAAQAEYDEAKAVDKRVRGSIPQTQMRRLKAKVEQAKLAVERARAVYELHVKSKTVVDESRATNPPKQTPPPEIVPR